MRSEERRQRVAIFVFRHPRLKILLESVIVVTIALGVKFGTSLLDKAGDKRHSGALSALALIVATVLVAFLLNLLRSSLDLEASKWAIVLANARSNLDQCVTRQLERLGKMTHSTTPDPMHPIDDLVQSLYLTLDSNYSHSDVPGTRIDFEVTFMARDYQDSFVTIMSWASREGRAPRSLSQRKQNPKIYETTVTAQVYRESETALPTMRIIENTDAAQEYAELYSRQKDRIKSSIVYPVLTADNILIGTLVAHCDRAKFFLEKKKKFWEELLELFAARIAVEKAALDLIESDRGN